MPKTKSARNKTIDLSIEEGQQYWQRCIHVGTRQNTLASIINKTIAGDAFTVMPLLPSGMVDLAIVDPPYNLTKDFHGTVFAKRSTADYEAYTRQWLELLHPLIRDTGAIYVCCDWETSLIVGRVLGEFFHIRSRITWQREKGRGAAANWKNGMEDIWFATKSDQYTFNLDAVKVRKKVIAPYRTNGQPKDWDETEDGNYRNTCPSNFWDDITIPFWSMPENTAHPTQKSEKLFTKIILASSNPGDLVFDPFLGSGTSSVVAKKLGRSYIGIETNPQYCVWAEKRLEMAESDRTIQGYTNGVFWERNSSPQQKHTSAKEA